MHCMRSYACAHTGMRLASGSDVPELSFAIAQAYREQYNEAHFIGSSLDFKRVHVRGRTRIQRVRPWT
jgi:hypothetical protein